MTDHEDDRDHRQLARIEGAIDREVGRGLIIAGSARFTNMLEVMEFAKLLATAQKAVPKHLRLNPGGCLAVTLQAMDWGMSPIALANKSYEVNDRVAYESQAVHAALEMSGKLNGRLRHTYDGEGPTRRCTVLGKIKGEDFDRGITSPMLKDIKVKNSPLWSSKPDVQLFYNTSRDWGRIHLPEVLLGVFAKDELEDSEIGADDAPRGTGLAARLTRSNGDEGYHPKNVEELGTAGSADELAQVAVDAAATTPDAPTVEAAAAEVASQPEADEPTPAAPAEQQGSDVTIQVDTVIDPSPSKTQAETSPTNKEEYLAHLKAWLDRDKDDAHIHDRFGEEKELRKSCGITKSEDLKECNALKRARLEQLGSA